VQYQYLIDKKNNTRLVRNLEVCMMARAAMVAERRNQMKKRERIYLLVNSLATEIDLGAKASKQIKLLVAELAREHGMTLPLNDPRKFLSVSGR
jgi:hypothetical protein